MRNNTSFLLILGIIGLFSCNPTVDPPTNPQPPQPPAEKPVSSLAYIVYQRSGATPSLFDSMQIRYDSATGAFKSTPVPAFNYYRSPGNPVLKASAIVGMGNHCESMPDYENYEFYFDAAGLLKSGIRATTSVPCRVSSGGGTATITDSIRYALNTDNKIISVTFFDRIIVGKYPPFFKNDTLITRGILELYTFAYDTAGSISKIHIEQGSNKKWDVEYSYGSGKPPMLTPEKYILTPNLILKKQRGYDFRLSLAMIQARHELTKIKTTDLVTGNVSETSFNYAFRPDGYPDIATVSETGYSDPQNSTWSSYNLKFVYNR